MSDNDDDVIETTASRSPRTSRRSQKLTEEQVERMNANRKRALEIKQKKEENAAKVAKLVNTIDNESSKKIDTGAGFFLDEEDLIEEEARLEKVVENPPVPPLDQHLTCQKCNTRFPHSFLSLKFELNVCDSCKVKHSDEYELITRTDAKDEYLLKDWDLDEREPPLKYVEKRNPHSKNRFSRMKLYLRSQCAARAMLVHEDEEKLVEKKEMRLLNLHKTRQKKYEKKIKELRKDAYKGAVKLTKYHEHEFGDEAHNETDDTYYRICKTCNYKSEYEKL